MDSPKMLPKVMSKAEVTKASWDALEGLLKGLKLTTGNATCGGVLKNMWEEVEKKITGLKWIEGIQTGSYYKYKSYNDQIVYFRLDGFSSDEYSVKFVASIVAAASTTGRWSSEDLAEVMYIRVSELQYGVEEIDVDKLELPLLIGYEFKTPLLEKLIKKQS